MKTILVDAINAFIVKGKGINQDLYALLETYPNPKIIVTNANSEQMIEFGLVDMPYPMFTMNHHPDKPDPLYFETLLKEKNLSVEDIVYFEHHPDACKSAESLGIKTHFYDMDKKDLESLKEFLDSNI